MRSITALALMGLAGGLMSGLLGVGGGIVLVPLLVLVMGLRPKVASATSLVAIVPLAGAGSLVYASAGLIDYEVGLWIGVGALAGIGIGIYLMRRLRNVTIARAFALVQFVVAALLLLR
jgi:uncharacterized membrane protein YfcA